MIETTARFTSIGRRPWCSTLALWACASAAVAQSPRPSVLPAAADETWTPLVVQNDLEKTWATTGNWKLVKDQTVELTPRPGEEGWRRFDAYLWSKKKYGDFEIEFDYRVEPQGNSGFFFRVGDVASPVEHGYEVQIFDSFGKPADAPLNDHDSGGVIAGPPPSKNAAKAPGKWNRFRIRVVGSRLTVWLNERLVNRVDLNEHPRLQGRPPRGYIGFQDHGMPLSLRKIRIREL